MKIFLQTDQGEQGPYSPAQINRMVAKGAVRVDQRCRMEGVVGTRMLQEQFRHLARPDEKIVAEARKRVTVYNLLEGGRMMMIGTGCITVGLFQLARGMIYAPRAFGFCVAGLIFLWQGYAQKRRANARRKSEVNGSRR